MWIDIDEKGLKNFEHLVPSDILYRIGKDEDYFGIGYTQSLDVLPDSVIIFKTDAEEDEDGEAIPIVDIKYFAVTEDKWHRGYFRGLFTEFLKVISDNEISAVRADIPMDHNYNDACRILEDFGFEFALTDVPVFIESLSRCRRAPLMNAEESDKDIHSISRYNAGEFKELISSLYKDGIIAEEEDVSSDINDYNADVSMIRIVDGEIKALSLINGPYGDMLDLLYVGGKGESEDAYAVLRCSMREAAAKYGWAARVNASIESELGLMLVADIFPDAQPVPVRRGYLVPEVPEET